MNSSLDSLIEVFMESERRIQPSLFLEQEVRDSLNGVLGLQDNGLYQRWTQYVDGKSRLLSVPKKDVLLFFKRFLLGLIKQREAHPQAHGGEVGWCARGSVESHVPCESVLSFDLQSAFEVVPTKWIYRFYHDILVGLAETERKIIADFLTEISTVPYSTVPYNSRRGLPIGASHSAALFNRVLYDVDCVFSEKARERDFRYSRWIDDFMISAQKDVDEQAFIGALELAMKLGLEIHPSKSFFQRKREGVYVLGHIISGEGVRKNTRVIALENKTKPLVLERYLGSSSDTYASWL